MRVQTAESSQRGFLVTGNEIYLAPYDSRESAGAAATRGADQARSPAVPERRSRCCSG